ncbi:MAG: MraY family glycosyltransferase [Candidatus Nanopelagicales bacterium]
MREYLVCFLVAAAVTYLVTPPVRTLAIRARAMAEVRDRDIHARPTPRWGGLAMYAGFLAGMLMASQLPQLSVVFGSNRQPLALIVGSTIIVGLGLLDDRFGLDAPTKFAGQVVAAGSMAFLGIQMVWLPIGGTLVLDPLTSVVLTVLFVVLTINAVNFVDGLDGLAAGIVAIAAAAFFVYAFLLSVEFGFDRATLAALICALLAGICVGFLPHNLNPAKLFMGDTGSMLIGLLLAASAITLSGRVDPSAVRGELLLPAILPLLLPLAVIAVPLIDVGMAVIRRTRRGRSPFAPDKEHLHHRLIELGHSQRRAVSLMHAWTALIAFSAVAVALIPWPLAMVVFLIGLGGLALLVSRPASVSRRS